MDNLDFKINNFINFLYNNQNNTNISNFKNFYSKNDYYNFLYDIIFLLQNYPNNDIKFYKEQLFINSHILYYLNEFINEMKMAPSMVLKYGTDKINDTIIINAYNENTLYDIASTSKTFTAVAILKLCENNLINLDDNITKYEPRFKNLKDITIFDLLSFKVSIKTKERIDKAKTKEEAENILFNIEYNENADPTFLYTDMGCLVLKYVVENVTNMRFSDFLNEEIFQKNQMFNTVLNPKDLKNVANENNSMIVLNDGKIINNNTPLGLVHDPKARILGQKDGIYPGHAGYFSNVNDMFTFAKNLANNKILNSHSIDLLTTPVVGNKNSYYFGLLNYSKQLGPNFIAVQPYLSGKSFLSPGFAGTSLCVDNLNKVYAFMAANRLNNRIYQIPIHLRKDIYTINKVRYYQGNIVNFDYTSKSQDIMNIVMTLAIKYKFLETIFDYKNEITYKKIIKK